MSKFENILAFTIGAAAGSIVTWKLIKNKYEQIAQEEIDSVKEVYSRRFEESNNEENKEEPKAEEKSGVIRRSGRHPWGSNEADVEPEMAEYVATVEEAGYSEPVNPPSKVKTIAGEIPYVISPEEYGDLPDYGRFELTYYADGVLADSDDEIVDDVDDVVGEESLTTFGTYEEDAVHVRNDRLKADYEILRDHRDYWGTRKVARPHHTEG